MFLYWLNFWFVSFEHSWNKIFKYWYPKCFILTCKRNTNQTWHFFQIPFQSDSCFSLFWTDSWKQKVKNVLCFHCANWNKPKSEPLASCERPSREISQGSCLGENIIFSLYSLCDHQAVADIPNRCPQLTIPQFLIEESWCIYTNVQLLPQEWILGQIHHFLLKSCLGNLAGIPGESLCFFQNIFLITRSKSFLLGCFPLYWIHIWQTKQPGVFLRQSLTSSVKIIWALQPAWLCLPPQWGETIKYWQCQDLRVSQVLFLCRESESSATWKAAELISSKLVSAAWEQILLG